jgi:hypothetical protein
MVGRRETGWGKYLIVSKVHARNWQWEDSHVFGVHPNVYTKKRNLVANSQLRKPIPDLDPDGLSLDCGEGALRNHMTPRVGTKLKIKVCTTFLVSTSDLTNSSVPLISSRSFRRSRCLGCKSEYSAAAPSNNVWVPFE